MHFRHRAVVYESHSFKYEQRRDTNDVSLGSAVIVLMTSLLITSKLSHVFIVKLWYLAWHIVRGSKIARTSLLEICQCAALFYTSFFLY